MARPRKAPERSTRPGRTTRPTVYRGFVAADQPPLPDVADWCTETREWWEKWAEHPRAGLMTVTDWETLKATAIAHHSAFADQDTKALPELRLRELMIEQRLEERARMTIMERPQVIEEVVEEPRAIEQGGITPYQRRLNELMEVHKHMPDDLYSVLEDNMKDLHWRELRDLEGAPNG